MSIRLLIRSIRNHGKSLLSFSERFCDKRHIRTVKTIHTDSKNLQKAYILDANLRNQQNSFVRFSRRLLIDNVLSRVTALSPKSSLLRAEATNKFATGDSLPFFSIVGCSLASGSGLLTKEDELEGICWEIREAVAKYQSKLETDNGYEPSVGDDLKLNDLNIGPFLQKGCNAVVYGANFKNEYQPDFRAAHQVNEEDLSETSVEPSTSYFTNSPRFVQNFGGSVDNVRFHSQPSPMPAIKPLKTEEPSKSVKFSEEVKVTTLSESTSSSTSSIPESLLANPPLSIYQYPWALKMMFNYDIQSNALTILKAMYKETIPARNRRNYEDVGNWERAIMEQTATLPPHPNIVLMPTFFCDQIPDLKHANDLYPSAMPPRLNPTSGYGRNMSLFLLMKRYNSNLREYLSENDLSVRTRIILFAQLLEAVAFVNGYGIAHRDLKSDNILVDTMSDSHLPLIVISDFGCCLADKRNGLRLPYTSYEIDKGGNANLMAPEIINKQPSMFSVLNYTKSDLWACGTIAYEIFGSENPFYGPSLRNVDYSESMLPAIDEEVPLIVRRLIANILQRNPSKRLGCDVAANVLELFLWAPSSWIKYGRNPSNNEVLEFLLSLTTKVLCERGLSTMNTNYMMKSRRTYTEYVLISTFLSRANLRNIRKAIEWIHSNST